MKFEGIVWIGIVAALLASCTVAGISITSVSPSYLPEAGGRWTITGTGFASHCGSYTGAICGGKTAGTSFVSCSDTQIVVDMPWVSGNTGGTATLQLQWSGGGSYSESNKCEYKTPSITSISPSSVGALTGGSITITGTNFGAQCNVYTTVSVQVGVSSGYCSSITGGTSMVAYIPPGQATNAAVNLHWGTAAYVSSSATFSHSNIPSISSFDPSACIPQTSGYFCDIWGNNFGTSAGAYTYLILQSGSTQLGYNIGTIGNTHISFQTNGGDASKNQWTLLLIWPNGQATIGHINFC